MANILVVDDDETHRLFERALLAGHDLFFAQDGEQALKTYQTRSIDLVVTDLHMPNLNGLRLIQKLKAYDRGALIIAVSGVSASDLDMAKKFGALYTLQKPFDPGDFLQLVGKALRGDWRLEQRRLQADQMQKKPGQTG